MAVANGIHTETTNDSIVQKHTADDGFMYKADAHSDLGDLQPSF
jgi:hypothetical protein